MLIVAASGNSEAAQHGGIATAQTSYPGAYPECLTVGAVDSESALADFSGTGSAVGLVAPGVGIYSSAPVGRGQREVSASFVESGHPLRVEVAMPDGSSGTALPPTAVVSCGYGSPSDIDLCRPVGKVALIQRGPADPHLAALTHEPLSALASGADGLDDLRSIIAQAPAHLAPGGWLLLEHGHDQAEAVAALLQQAGLAQVQSRKDLAGIVRCSGGQRPTVK